MVLREIEGSDGDQFDVLNAAGYEIGWISRKGGDQGVMTLMSTGAPLTEGERAELADRIGRELGERVQP